MTSSAQRKGDDAERELVQRLRALGLVDADRSYGAGRRDDRGDLDGLPGVVAQVKHYADAWRAVRDGMDGAMACVSELGLDAWPVAFVRWPRRSRWLVGMDLEPWVDLYRTASNT